LDDVADGAWSLPEADVLTGAIGMMVLYNSIIQTAAV